MTILPASILEMLRQLPPSGAELRLLDISDNRGALAHIIRSRRPDVSVTHFHPRTAQSVQGQWAALPFPTASIDAVLAEGTLHAVPDHQKVDVLRETWRVLRPGGRIVLFDELHDTPEAAAQLLLSVDFGRVLAERLPDGIMYRGEKPYDQNLSTIERVSIGAGGTKAATDSMLVQGDAVRTLKGRYIHLLIQQTPNKPVWRLQPDEKIEWQAVAIQTEGQQAFLAFSSLPKAVNFMQQAILDGWLSDVNKVGKFKQQVVADWDNPLLWNANASQTSLQTAVVQFIEVDVDSAEAADE